MHFPIEFPLPISQKESLVKLKALKILMGDNQQQVADILGYSRATIYRFFDGDPMPTHWSWRLILDHSIEIARKYHTDVVKSHRSGFRKERSANILKKISTTTVLSSNYNEAMKWLNTFLPPGREEQAHNIFHVAKKKGFSQQLLEQAATALGITIAPDPNEDEDPNDPDTFIWTHPPNPYILTAHYMDSDTPPYVIDNLDPEEVNTQAFIFYSVFVKDPDDPDAPKRLVLTDSRTNEKVWSWRRGSTFKSPFPDLPRLLTDDPDQEPDD
jgi:hypothetical protein